MPLSLKTIVFRFLTLRSTATFAAVVAIFTLSTIALAQSPDAGSPGRPSSSTPSPEPSLGGSGESCTKAADCQAGLKCIAQVCIDPARGREGDQCSEGSACNAHLSCEQGRCMTRSSASATASPATGAPSGSSTPSVAPSPAPPYVPPPQPRRPATWYAGITASAGIGYGTDTVRGYPGLAWAGYGSWRFARMIGVGWVVSGVSTKQNLGAYLVGLHVGHVVYAQGLIGSVVGGKKRPYPAYMSDTVQASFGAGLAAGLDLSLGASWAFNPQVILAKGFENDAWEVIGVVGFGVSAPRADE